MAKRGSSVDNNKRGHHDLRKAKLQEQQQQQQQRNNNNKIQSSLSLYRKNTKNHHYDKVLEKERRSALLTRDSKEKYQEGRLRLHIKRTQRQLDQLRCRLEAWDDMFEAQVLIQQQQQEEEARRKQREETNVPPKKKGRLGPETWKLKGAARPAWQVYDFDTRYVDPHQKAHHEAAQKAARSRNIMELCQRRFGNEQDEDVPQPYCRQYLALLMQLGLLSMQSKQFKTARKAFLECMDLDSTEHPVTLARCYLMRLYMEVNRPESARRLYEQRLLPTDPSVWIRYSAVLIEYVSWKILKEDVSTQVTTEQWLARAIRSNIFCAYYLAFWDTFNTVMEHTDEIEDANDSSPLEEAIEYCNSEQLGAWKGTEGAMEWIQQVVTRVLNGGSVGMDDDKITASDLDWRKPLAQMKETWSIMDEIVASPTEDGVSQTSGDNNDGNNDDNEDDEDESVVDLAMFATMFETAMDMLEASGQMKIKQK